MTHNYHPNAEYLSPADAEVLNLSNEGGSIDIRFVLPCPDCDETLEHTATVDHIGESDRDARISPERLRPTHPNWQSMSPANVCEPWL